MKGTERIRPSDIVGFEPLSPVPTTMEDTQPIIIDTDQAELASPVATKASNLWQSRLTSANRERKLMSKVWGLLLGLFALINAVPVCLFFYQADQVGDLSLDTIPRWVFMLVLMVMLIGIYPWMIWQIPDWSALRCAAIITLLMAFCFGVLVSGLFVAAESNSLLKFLELDHRRSESVILWLLAMLGLASLLAYGLGREASQWQRTERALDEIISDGIG